MRFIPKIWFALAVYALFQGVVSAASFTASLDRDTITMGESATLSLSFEGATPRTVPSPTVPGLMINKLGTSQSYSAVMDANGNSTMTATVTVTFSVTPQHVGEFLIPEQTADLGGQQLSTTPLKLSVGKVAAPSAAALNSGNEVAFLKLVFPKTKIYAGESAVASLELYFRDDVQNYGNFQLTGSPTEGFSAGKTVLLQNQNRRVQVGNRVYTVVSLAVPLTAVKTGALTLGPFTASVVAVLPGGFFGEQRQVNLVTEPVNVECVPLPDEGRPANFNGAIGSYTMTATAGPASVTVGDPITVRVKVSGKGSFDSLTLPPQDAWQNFKTYPPTTKMETSDQFGFQGAKTFELIISPINTDVHELPPLRFSYFNPEDNQYHTLKSMPAPLTVHAAGATPMPVLAPNKNAASDNQSPADILPIKDRLDAVTRPGQPLLAQPAFLAAQSLPVLAFLAAFVWRRRTDNLANNPRLRRRRAVALLIASGMGDLKKYATANQPDEFFATLFRLLQEQLGERLDCPASAITENVMEGHALLRSAPAATRTGLHELFQLCNQARYAPVRGTAELNSVAAQFEKVIRELQDLKS